MAGERDSPGARAMAWIDDVGRPMRQDVEGLKRAFWWAAGTCGGAGVVLGVVGAIATQMAPYVLKKLGLG